MRRHRIVEMVIEGERYSYDPLPPAVAVDLHAHPAQIGHAQEATRFAAMSKTEQIIVSPRATLL